MSIFKYILKLTDEQTIKIPGLLKVLTAQKQNGSLCVWAIVDQKGPLIKVKFRIYGTGHPFNTDNVELMYISTVQDEQFVWHVFMEQI